MKINKKMPRITKPKAKQAGNISLSGVANMSRPLSPALARWPHNKSYEMMDMLYHHGYDIPYMEEWHKLLRKNTMTDAEIKRYNSISKKLMKWWNANFKPPK